MLGSVKQTHDQSCGAAALLSGAISLGVTWKDGAHKAKKAAVGHEADLFKNYTSNDKGITKGVSSRSLTSGVVKGAIALGLDLKICYIVSGLSDHVLDSLIKNVNNKLSFNDEKKSIGPQKIKRLWDGKTSSLNLTADQFAVVLNLDGSHWQTVSKTHRMNPDNGNVELGGLNNLSVALVFTKKA